MALDGLSPAPAGAFEARWQRNDARLRRALRRGVPAFLAGLPPAHLAQVQRLVSEGKRLRAGLLCLVGQVLGARSARSLAPALALECVHGASLIHDDYVDGDATRRQRPATWTEQGARRAVLLGDVIMATAIERLCLRDPACGAVIAWAIAHTARGALEEFGQPANGPWRPAAGRDYERIVSLKTGALFAAAAELAAVVAGASELRAALREYGLAVGRAYQLGDDLLDLHGLCAPGASGHLPAPLLMRFGRDLGVAEACAGPGDRARLCQWLAGVQDVLQARIAAALRDQLAQAAALAQGLPLDGPQRALLHLAPAAMLRRAGLGEDVICGR